MEHGELTLSHDWICLNEDEYSILSDFAWGLSIGGKRFRDSLLKELEG